MSLVSSDDDEIDMLATRHLEQVSFRISPPGLDDGGYFLLRQKCRNAFLQITFKILLNHLWILRQGQRPFISQSPRFIRGPVTIKDGDLGFANFPELIHPTQSGFAGDGKIISNKNLQRVLAANPGSEPPTRTSQPMLE